MMTNVNRAQPDLEAAMKSNTTTILVAVSALLVGGVATAAFLKGGDKGPAAQDGLVTAVDGSLIADDTAATGNEIPTGTLQYATVVKADPITSSEKLYATVIGTEAVRETTTTSTPPRNHNHARGHHASSRKRPMRVTSGTRPRMARTSVDLPEPFAPRIATTSPRRTVRSRSVSTGRPS